MESVSGRISGPALRRSVCGFLLIEDHVPGHLRWDFHSISRLLVYSAIYKNARTARSGVSIGRYPRCIQHINGRGDAFTTHPASKYRIPVILHGGSQSFGYGKGIRKGLGCKDDQHPVYVIRFETDFQGVFEAFSGSGHLECLWGCPGLQKSGRNSSKACNVSGSRGAGVLTIAGERVRGHHTWSAAIGEDRQPGAAWSRLLAISSAQSKSSSMVSTRTIPARLKAAS